MTNVERLLQARYVNETPAFSGGVGSVIETALNHRSVRNFTANELPAGTLERLTAAAQSAATSSNLQSFSIIAIADPARKSEVATLCGDQEFIRQAPLFLLFCADLSRLTFVSEAEGLPGEALDYLEMFLIGCVDASLAGQNTALSAESMGLGICYVGAARNRPVELATLLNFPKKVFALFGMAIGFPAENSTAQVKPRLGQSEILHHEVYSPEQREEQISHYDSIMQAAYEAQGRPGIGTWSHHTAKRVATAESLNGRHTLSESLRQLGFELK